MASAEPDEWEYQYDEHETEDFYIPIDVANVPSAQGPINALPNTGHPMLLKTKLKAINAELRETQNSTEPALVSTSQSRGSIQINRLHTLNPLVIYKDQLLSCQWTATIGTDLLFAKPNLEADNREEPLCSLPSVDLLATSSAKLVARVAWLQPQDNLFSETSTAEQATDSIDTSSQYLNSSRQPCESVAAMEVEKATERIPSSFLERLNAAKARRGDKSLPS